MHQSQNLRKYRVSTPFDYYSITTVSNQRKPIFHSLDIAQIVIKNIGRLDKDLVSKTIFFVLMPDHIHWLFQLQNKLPLCKTVQYFKGRSAER